MDFRLEDLNRLEVFTDKQGTTIEFDVNEMEIYDQLDVDDVKEYFELIDSQDYYDIQGEIGEKEEEIERLKDLVEKLKNGE